MKPFRYALIIAVGILACGCGGLKMGMPQASMATFEKVRTPDFPAMRVGNFVPAPAVSGKKDKNMGFRLESIDAPVDNSFAKYLGRTIELNLQAAGKYDASAPFVLEGVMTENNAETPIGEASAILGAKFTLTKSGSAVFEKHLVVNEQWHAGFMGAVAIPESINHYTSLYDKLTLQLFMDPDFVAAAKTK